MYKINFVATSYYNLCAARSADFHGAVSNHTDVAGIMAGLRASASESNLPHLHPRQGNPSFSCIVVHVSVHPACMHACMGLSRVRVNTCKGLEFASHLLWVTYPPLTRGVVKLFAPTQAACGFAITRVVAIVVYDRAHVRA